jgi:PKD domain
MRTKWINIGGREPGDCSPPDGPGSGPPCLWRWFWDASSKPSPNAVVRVNGMQSNLEGSDEPKCGTDSICDVKNATTAWPGVGATDIRLSGPSTTGNITVNLDSIESPDNGMAWNSPVGCDGGVIGLGGPNEGSGPRTYRGDSTYYAITSGTIAMRKSTCGLGYSAATFRSAVLHEVGHVLGLDHPDQGMESIHSTTTSVDWGNAVMHAVIVVFKPDTPQTDDIQAMQYLYGTAAVDPPPVANFTFSPSSPPALSGVAFTDTSTGNPTGWNWDFGDPNSNDNTAMTQTATHGFTKAGTYNVTLTAGNLNGSSSITFPVTVGPALANCTPDPEVLCLNHGRFRVVVQWAKTDLTSGFGNAVSLTGDSGYFWFFDPSNIEVIVKVLDGCSVGGHYWVFAAGLTNILTTLSVIDTTNNTPKLYTNPQGTPFAPIQDTAAFATCP